MLDMQLICFRVLALSCSPAVSMHARIGDRAFILALGPTTYNALTTAFYIICSFSTRLLTELEAKSSSGASYEVGPAPNSHVCNRKV